MSSSGVLTADPKQVVFIDSRAPDIQALIAGVQPGELVFVLDPTSDGVQQIADILAANNLTNLDSISIVGHGASGEIDLGTTVLNDADLAVHAAALSTIGAALAPGGDLALYACSTAAGAAGQQFIADLSQYAGGIDVAAATHLVGDTAHGGSWTLDASTGAIEASTPFTKAALASFQGELSSTTIDGQLWFGGARLIGASTPTSDNQIGYVNWDGSTRVAPTHVVADPHSGGPDDGFFDYTSVGLDTVAGLYFGIGSNSGGPTDTGSGSLDIGRIGTTDTLIQSLNLNPTDYEILSVAVDPVHHVLYIGVWGDSNADTGIIEFGYDSTGTLYKVGTSTVVTSANLFSGGVIDPSYYVVTDTGHHAGSTGGDPFTNAKGFSLDVTNQKLYFAASAFDSSGNPVANYPASNGVYVLDLATQKTQQLTTTQFGTGAGGNETAITAVAIDTADGIIYFETRSVGGGTSAPGIYWMPIGGGTAFPMALPSGVTLDSIPTGGGLAFDTVSRQLLVSAIGSGTTGSVQSLVYALQLDGTGQHFSSGAVVTQLDSANPTAAATTGLTFDALATIGTLTATSTQAVQGGSGITLLGATPTGLGDTDSGGFLASATVTISNAQSGDVLGIDPTFSHPGFQVSYDSSTHTLTITNASGVENTFAQYDALLAHVTFTDTGTDTTTVGHPTRTITWQVNDGAAGNPANTDPGGNVATTSVTIDRAPTAVADTGTVVEGATTTSSQSVLSNDSDKDGDTITLVGIKTSGGTIGTIGAPLAGLYGQLTLLSNGNYTYVANNTSAIDAAPNGSRPVDNFLYTVSDGTATTTTQLSITIDRPPTLSLDTTSETYNAGDPPTALQGTVTIADQDGDAISSATVTLTGGNTGDQLSIKSSVGTVNLVNGSGTVVLGDGSHYNVVYSGAGSTETLTITTASGTGTAADYQQLLDAVVFSSNATDPTSGGVHASRSATFQVTDTGGASSASAGPETITIPFAPTVSSIVVPAGTSNPNNAASETFTVTFSEDVTGVDPTDFTATRTGSVADTGITVTPVSGSVYTVTVNGVTGDGTLRLDLNSSGTGIQDGTGHPISGGFTSGDVYTIEHTPPAVTSVGVPANATYIAGQNLDFTVNFSEAVTVNTGSGTPELALTLDTGGTVQAQYLSGSGTSALTFRYTVVGGEADTNGIGVDSAINLNGGAIQDAATNNAVLTLNSVGSTAGVLVDSIPPTVSSVAVPSDGTYGAGQVLTFTVNFSENVLVTGTPYLSLTLDTGGTVHAAYTGGTGSNALTFAYTVVSGEDDPNGIVVGSAITLNGGTIKDTATNAATLTLNSVGSTTNVLVDAIPPTVTSINTVDSATNNLSTEHFTVTFSKPVNGVDASDFTVVGFGGVSGSVTSVSGSGTTYTVTVGSVVGDGTLRLDLNTSGDPITDNFGNTLVAAHTGDQKYTIEHTPPAVTAVTVPTDGTYVAGQNLDFTATFSENVTVDSTGGTPRIAITLDTGGTVYADYLSGSGTSALTFRYTIVPGNQDLTGIVTATSIDANGGTIKDAATNDAVLTLTGEPSTSNVDVDAIVPAVSNVGVPNNGTYGTGQDLDFTVHFTKLVTVNTGGGTPYIQLTLDTGGTVNAVYLSGSGTSSLVFRYVVASGELDTNGITVGSSLVTNGGTIQDAVGNNTATTLNSVGSTTGVLVDSILPTVTSINTVDSATNNLSTEHFTVTFSTDVSLNPPDTTDFTLHTTGSISGTIASVTAVNGSTYTVTVTGVTGDGTMRLDLNTSGTTITDAFGNPVTAPHTGDQNYTIQHTPPSATAMTVPANGTYVAGQNMTFTTTFSENVTVDTTGGTPRIAITLDTGGTVYANYLSGTGTNTLTFQFTPVAGEQDLTGIVTATSIDSNGGTIKDAAGNSAVLAISAVEPSTAGIDVDAIAPAVTSVGVPTNATYIAGQDLDFTVNLNKPVTVDTSGGTPYITLTLDTGGTVNAAYISGSGTSSLTFRYVVAPGNLDSNGVTLGSAIVLNGGTIDDSHNNAAVLNLNGVASTSGVLVDAVPPTVSSISDVGSSPNNATSEQFTVTFSEAVTGVDASDFSLHDTGTVAGTIASVVAVNPSTYTVTVNGVTGDGTMRLDLNSSGTGIADLATNPIATGFTAGQTYTIDHTAPTTTTESFNSASGTQVGTGGVVTFTVNMSEAVIVTNGGGLPTLRLNDGEVATYSGPLGSSTSALTFSYTVQPSDNSSDLQATAFNALAGGTTIRDAAGNNADLSHFTTIDTGVSITTSQPLFGAITHDVTSAGGDIYALYETILGRAPDPIGFEGWVAALNSGTSLTTIAQSFLSSSEYTADYGPYAQSPNSSFVNQLYLDGLHRPAEPGGLSAWDGALAQGTSRAQVAVDIALSQEAQGNLAPAFQTGVFVPSASDAAIARLYYGVLDRAPDAGGLASWEGAFAQGMSLTTIASDFIGSSEYAAHFGNTTNAQFVNALYEGALGRPPDPSGGQGWVNQLNLGASRASVALGIAEGSEAVTHLASQIETGFKIA